MEKSDDGLTGHADFKGTAEWSRGDVQAVGCESLKQHRTQETQKGKSSAYWWQVETAVMRWASEKRTEKRVLREIKKKIIARLFNIMFVLKGIRSKLKEGI